MIDSFAVATAQVMNNEDRRSDDERWEELAESMEFWLRCFRFLKRLVRWIARPAGASVQPRQLPPRQSAPRPSR